MAFAMVAGLAPRSLVGAHHHASLQRQAPMRRSVCMSKLTDSAELSSYAPATPPQKPARPRAEASSAEASTAEASTPPVTVQNGPVPELELSVGDKTVTAVGLWMGFSVFLTAIAVQQHGQVPTWQAPSSPAAPPRGAPGGSGWRALPRGKPGHRAPTAASGTRASHPFPRRRPFRCSCRSWAHGSTRRRPTTRRARGRGKASTTSSASGPSPPCR